MTRSKTVPHGSEIVIPELEESAIKYSAMIWSPEEEAIIRKYYPLGVPGPQILKHLKAGKTLNMLYRKADALGLTRRKV